MTTDLAGTHPLTPERFADLEALFAEKGCSFARGCWCMDYRVIGKQIPPGRPSWDRSTTCPSGRSFASSCRVRAAAGAWRARCSGTRWTMREGAAPAPWRATPWANRDAPRTSGSGMAPNPRSTALGFGKSRVASPSGRCCASISARNAAPGEAATTVVLGLRGRLASEAREPRPCAACRRAPGQIAVCWCWTKRQRLPSLR